MVSYDINPNQGAQNSESNRLNRLRSVGDELANDQTARAMEMQQEANAAWKGAYADASQPVSQDPSGSQNITTGQTQVQAVPVSATPAPPSSPLAGIQIPASALAPPQAGSAPHAAIPTLPPATAFDGATGAPIPAGTPAQPSVATVPTAAPANAKASPFDSPEFQQQLAQHLSVMPNGGLALQGIKKERDATIGRVMEAIANGHTDEARFMAQQNGLNIPENLYQNSNMAQGLSFAQKAYPDEPDKGQAFYQAFMSAQGDVPSRVQAGMSAGGVPTPAGQRQLANAIALAKFNFGNEMAMKQYEASAPQVYSTMSGLVSVSPRGGTATPITYPGGAPITNVIGGKGINDTAAAMGMMSGTQGNASATAPASTNSGAAPTGPVTGDAALEKYPAAYRPMIKAIARGDQPFPPAGRSMTPLMANVIMPGVYAYDSTANAGRLPAITKFGTSQQGNQTRSLNVAVAHLGTLDKLAEALDNNDVGAFNSIKNTFQTQFGSPAPTNFNAAKQIVSDEIVKAVIGAGGGVTDRQEAANTVNSARSPEQLKGVIQTYKQLMSGQLIGLEKQYEGATKGLKDYRTRYLMPETIKELEGSSAPAAPNGQALPTFTDPNDPAFQALPPGSHFLTSDGRTMTKN